MFLEKGKENAIEFQKNFRTLTLSSILYKYRHLKTLFYNIVIGE